MSNLKKSLKVNSEAERDAVDKQIDATNQTYAEKLAAYKPPSTAQEWWDVLRDWWPEIVALWRRYVLLELDGMHVTSDAQLVEMRRKRDITLERLCHRAWFAAPDSGSIHAIPGWSVLCDLCSEAGVLYDQDKCDGTLVPVPLEECEKHPESAIDPQGTCQVCGKKGVLGVEPR